jgi:predicted alpha/beta superfamily hydrolase
MRTLVFATLSVVAPCIAAAQTDGAPVEIARSYTIDSKILGQRRTIDITLPTGYARDTAQRYPVIVALDGEFEGNIASSIAKFYAGSSMLPNTIVVAVRNTNRTLDMTPAPVAGFTPPPDANGGADKFLAFFADELVPYINAHYRTSPMRVLIGHSLGGLFALHTLAKRPQLFTGYVVMEPAAWWNNQLPHRMAEEALRRPDARRARVMLVNAQGFNVDTTAWGGDRPMVRNLRVPDETHASMAAAGMLIGLRTLFADFRPSVWRPGSRPITMLDRYDSLSARLGYPAPIPEDAFSLVFRMSLNSRWFDDAQKIVDRMERDRGKSSETAEMRTRLASARSAPAPAGWIPLVMAPHRPTPREAARFLGKWRLADGSGDHDVEIRASGDTIIVHDRIPFPGDEPFDADDPVVQLTPDGTLEWGLPWFRGLAALVVLKARIETDGTMVVTREPRGWVPIQNGPDMRRVERFIRR